MNALFQQPCQFGFLSDVNECVRRFITTYGNEFSVTRLMRYYNNTSGISSQISDPDIWKALNTLRTFGVLIFDESIDEDVHRHVIITITWQTITPLDHATYDDFVKGSHVN